MQHITRRTALAGIASISATGSAEATLAASMAPEAAQRLPATVLSPREEAIWHLRELERLIFATGPEVVMILAFGHCYPDQPGPDHSRIIGIDHDRSIIDTRGMFDRPADADGGRS